MFNFNLWKRKPPPGYFVKPALVKAMFSSDLSWVSFQLLLWHFPSPAQIPHVSKMIIQFINYYPPCKILEKTNQYPGEST